jgi:hypothetical protein
MILCIIWNFARRNTFKIRILKGSHALLLASKKRSTPENFETAQTTSAVSSPVYLVENKAW